MRSVSRLLALFAVLLFSAPTIALDSSSLPNPKLSLDTAVERSLGSGPVSLRRILAPSILTRLSFAQLADVSSNSGHLDVSNEINTALNDCGPNGLPTTLIFPRGVYGVALPTKAVTCTVNIVLEAGAVLKQIAPFPLTSQVDSIFAVIQFGGNAHGSTLTGAGTIDGNRSDPAILSAYLAGPRSVQDNGLYVMRNLWDCVAIGGVNDVRVEGITARNCMTLGIERSSGGARAQVRNVRILDSTVALGANENYGDKWLDITAENIGNVVNGQAIPMFSYAMNFFTQENLTVNNITLDGYQALIYDGTAAAPGSRIGDPNGAMIFFQRLKNGNIHNLTARNYKFNTAEDKRRTRTLFGAFCDNCRSVAMGGLTFEGAYYGLQISGSQKVTVNGFSIDGLYNTDPVAGTAEPYGVSVIPTSQLRGNPGLSSAFDHNNMDPGSQIQIANGTVRRSGIGMVLRTGNVMAANLDLTANTLIGLQTFGNNKGPQYPGSAFFPVLNVSLSNIRSTYNYGTGFMFADCVDCTGSNLVANNNGQDVSGGVPYGIWVATGTGPATQRIFFNGWQANDDQAGTLAAALSFKQGPTANDNTFQAIASTSADLHVGQSVSIINGGGAGTNITARVRDINNDFVTLKAGAPATLNDTACRTALPGTVSVPANSNILAGSGTNFTSSIKGPAYLLAGGQYLKVGGVLSDTQLQMDTQATAALSGLPAQLVQCAAQGVATQQWGFQAVNSPNVRDISLGSPSTYRAAGNIAGPVSIGLAQRYNDWTPYTPSVSYNAGSGVVTTIATGNYKIDGRTMCVNGTVTATYGSAPNQVIVGLPPGTSGYGTLVGANTATYNPISGFFNGGTQVALAAPTGALFSASGQGVSYAGCYQLQ